METTQIFNPHLFDGKVAFVTGGGSGICMGMAESLMRHGARSVIVSRNLEKLQASASLLKQKTGQDCLPIQADVRDFKAMTEAVRKTIEVYGRIDIVICGAAGNFLSNARKLSANAFKSVIDIDLIGTFHTVKATLPSLILSKGSIINVSATLQYCGTPLQSAAKAGVDAMTKVLAIEWGHYGIRVNAIAPADTVGMSKLTPKGTDTWANVIPLKKYGTIKDIEYATVFLASPAAKFITGSTLVVDGGQWLIGTGGIYNDRYLNDVEIKSKL